jgi:hypothetical protein
MRLLFTSFSFVVTMIVGALAFAFTALEFPAIMRDLIAYGQALPGYLSSLGVSDRYLVWVDILLSGDKLVLLGFILATRILFTIVGGIVSIGADPAPSRSSDARQGDASVFNRWGRSS